MLLRVGAELDLTRLTEIERVLGNGLPEIIKVLISDIASAVTEIESGCSAGDSQAVALAAHAARNSALMLDAQPMLGSLSTIETAARADDLRAAGENLEQLGSNWTALRSALERELSAHQA